MRLLPLFSKPRNDEFWGILEFLTTFVIVRLAFSVSSPDLTRGSHHRDHWVKSGDDIVGNSKQLKCPLV